MTKDLPYPYTSAAQYEASLRGAVGSEWSTRATVQKATMPRVVTKVCRLLPRRRPPPPLTMPARAVLSTDGHHHPPTPEAVVERLARAGFTPLVRICMSLAFLLDLGARTEASTSRGAIVAV